MRNRLAIVKPDHLGDLILSSAASKNQGLARFLFPDAEIRLLDLPHLSKTGGEKRSEVDLSEYGQIAMLRTDNVINNAWLAERNPFYVLPADTHELHQSVIDYSVVRALRGVYDIDTCHFGDRVKTLQAKAAKPPKTIGLSIGSGFHANAWPIAKWVGLCRALRDRCESLVVLCGPAERAAAERIQAAVGGDGKTTIIQGGSDVASFVGAVADLDLVVATDGGTAHLCSLAAPLVSVFGPSPFLRYAPFGRHNRLLTRRLSCSPCCQYAGHLINTCLSNECMAGIAPEEVAAITRKGYNAQRQRPSIVPPAAGGSDLVVVYGTSHVGREEVLDAFDS